jgi:hypothetical protein
MHASRHLRDGLVPMKSLFVWGNFPRDREIVCASSAGSGSAGATRELIESAFMLLSG